MPTNPTDECIVLAHGGGGELMSRLIREHLLPPLNNERLAPLTDSAVLPRLAGDIVFTTDSYVVTPLEFPGGDIGRLAVAGTVNDLAVMGAEPVALSLGLILEEGLALDLLDRIIASIADTAEEAGVEIVTGDTKVIERRASGPEAGTSDGLFINTAGVGQLRSGISLDLTRVQPGDAVIVNGTIADHGLAVMSRRSGIEFETELRSDAAPLNHLLTRVFETGAQVRFVRDATRGGIAGVLADISETTDLSIEIDERRVPISPTARHAAEMLGLDPLTVANEGKVICVVADADADNVLRAMHQDPLGKDAACIGRVTSTQPPLVELLTAVGGRRIVQRPYGEELPRIC
ncbi:MAG: hydrogenase expression/formation protein HypE [Planctomycetes bacterium]|nr:hydrogenase expression/formation protein HypE [Planctomycetota bacterium]